MGDHQYNDAPTPREFHTAVWTGSEIIVWGGYPYFSYGNNPERYQTQTAVPTGKTPTPTPTPSGPGTGGRYNPGTDTWIATSTTNAPTVRTGDTAVWTGTEMIVWGGIGASGSLNTGGRYNPSTDSWTAMSISNAPAGRSLHTAVWSGSEMIIWGGGTCSLGCSVNSGGRYHPIRIAG